MQFSNEDDAGDFDLNAGVRSRLSSLFQAEGNKGDVNQALTFTAPKQPKKTDPAQNNPGEFKLIASGVVNAFKLIDGSYVSQGKLGCAVLGVHHNAVYQFLLYKAKRVQVMVCKIHPSFKFHVQPNNYVNFYDDRNENWSINFESEGSLCEIAKQVAIAKANCEGKSPITLVVQDLALGEGAVLDKGDSAEIKYTGWLLSNYSLGQEFDSNMKSESPFRLRLGKSKVIKGWHEGLLGAQKGCKRLLIIPPSLGYGSEGLGTSIPPNSTLIFEVHVVKVKRARELSHSPSPKLPDTTVPDRKPEVTPRSSFSQEDNIKLRGASISEQLTQSPKKDKAQLISRMAKMGTATLPFHGAIPAQVNTSSDEEEVLPESPPVPVSSSRTASPKPSLPRSRNNSGSVSSNQSDRTMSLQAETVIAQVSQQSSPLIHPQASLNTQSPYLVPSVAYPSYQRPMDPYQFSHPQFPLPFPQPSISPSIADTHMPLLITESRTQNAETRLSLSKISDKVDTAIQKIDELRLNQGKSSHVPFLDSSILVQNIERIIQENRQLKEDVESKNAKIQVLNDKVHDLFQRNQRFYEENNIILEQKNESSLAQEKLINLEKENAELSSELMDVENKIKTMESELLRYKNQEIEYNQRIQELQSTVGTQSNDSSKDSELIKLQNQLLTTEEEKNNIAAKLESMEKQKESLLESEKSLKKKMEEMETKLERLKTAVPASEVNELKKSYETQISSYKDQLKEASSSQLLTEAQSSLEEFKKKVLELEAELKQSMLWKQKFESFHLKTRALKESYENRISEYTHEIKQLQETRSNPVSAEFSGELRKVMNALYRILQGMFDTNASYQGSKVLEMTLQAIKALTLRMLEMKSRASTASEKELESGNASTEKEVELGEAKSSSAEEKTGSGDTLKMDESPQLNGVDDNENKASGDPPKTISGEEKPVLAQSDRDSDFKTADESDSKSSDSKFNQNSASDSSMENISTKNIEEPSQTSDLSNVSNEKKVEIVNRDSPDSTEHSSNLIETPAQGNKIWRPQPPPLFDTDEEEDDDSWLK